MAKLFTRSTLGGLPLLNSSAVRWALKDGVDPHVEFFEVDAKTAKAIRGNPAQKPVTLIIQSGNDTAKFENLWVLDVQPGPNPHIFRVRVADRRWFWSYGHTIRRYNMRRRTGFRSVMRNDQLQLQDVLERVWYARYSMKIESDSPRADAWTAPDVLEDAIKAALKVESEYAGIEPLVSVNSSAVARSMPIENLELDDKSHNAIRRAMSYVPEAGLFVDQTGNVIVYAKTSGKERELVRAIAPEKVTDSHIAEVSNTVTRPSEMRILFTVDSEVKFEFFEVATAVAATAAGESDARTLANVLPVPDFQLEVSSPDTGAYTVPQGTWIDFDQAFRAWSNLTSPNNITIDHDVVQQAFMPFMDLWAALDLVGRLEPDVDWGSRIAAIQSNYRTTYRLPRRWVDRYLSIRANRIGTVDQASGQRAPAPVYSNYAILGSQRSTFLDAIGQNDLTYAINIHGFDPPYVLGNLVRPASADLQIVDADQGIIHINYKIDRYRVYEMILPSLIDEATIPVGNIKQNVLLGDGRNILFNGIIEGQQVPRLAPSHRIAVIVSCVPAAPNDERQLFSVVVKPEDILAHLPPSAKDHMGTAGGPPMTIRIGASVETARIAWNENRAADIDAIFGFGIGALQEDPKLVPSKAAIESLVTNLGDVAEKSENGIMAGSLSAIAVATAARVYASMIDRLEGSASGTIKPSLALDGWADSIIFELMPNGNFNTRVTLPDRIQELDMLAYLDASTRKIILRQAQPPGAS